MYRYLKFLEDQGLIAVAGQRVTSGKTATETLYCRTANHRQSATMRHPTAPSQITSGARALSEREGAGGDLRRRALLRRVQGRSGIRG